MTRRHAGVQLPLFSVRSTSGWGIGELPDLEPLAGWLADAGFDRLLLLPLGTMGAGETSPYSAASTMAIDPIYIAIDRVEDFAHAGGLGALSAEAREHREMARQSPRILYDSVRRAKHAALDLAFTRFLDQEWAQLTTRASALAAFIARERWWLDDYALFQAIQGVWPGASWRDWPEPVRDRHPGVLDEGRRELWRDILKQQYWQWIADAQWQMCRRAARERGVSLVGDLPFVASHQSAEVWARPGEFLSDVSLGVPPDAFSATGQDWSLPTYNWQAIAATDYAWIRQRARRMVALYDGVRIDHLIGFFRTYGRPRDGGAPFFNPPTETQQIVQGEAILRIFLETGSELLAEDLGVVPDFVRVVLARLDVPGCKVLRWERAWHLPEQPFINTTAYPPVSAALTGTHDTEPLALWWEVIDAAERQALVATPSIRARGISAGEPWSDGLRDALLELAYTAGSEGLFLPFQDLFGWRDRINTPGTVAPENWSWSLPWPIDRLASVPEAMERAVFCRSLSIATGRSRRST